MSDQTDRQPDGARGGPTGPEPRVEWLSVIGDVDLWRSLGLTVTDDGLIPLVGASLRLVPPSDRTIEVGDHRTIEVGDEGAGASAASRTGISGWALSGVPASEHIEHIGQVGQVGHTVLVDGLPTDIVEPSTPVYTDHPLGASGLDHVVVLTDDLERTSGEIAAASGCELRRIREVGSMRQGFHRIGRGGLIVELVERPDVDPGPASFWGLVLIVDDLDLACDLIGPDRISSPKDAVQPGRRIATVRADVGLGLPLALMSH